MDRFFSTSGDPGCFINVLKNKKGKSFNVFGELKGFGLFFFVVFFGKGIYFMVDDVVVRV